MAVYAIDDLDDAWAATREFLTPLSIKRLLVLAVIVFFVGGAGTSFSSGGGGSGTPAGTAPGPEPTPEVVREFVVENALLIGLLGGGVLLVVLAFTFVSALMEFVFVQSLRTDEVRFWGYSRSYLEEGLRLFGFRLALSVLWALPVGLFVLSILGAGSVAEVSGAVLVVLGIAAVLVFLLTAVIDAVTTAFVVPIMLLRGSGLLDGWRTFWPTVTGQWVQYLAYLIGAFVLNIALGVVFALLLGLTAIVLLVPLGIVVAGTAFLAEPLLFPVAVVCGLLFVGGLLLAGLLLQVPLQTYLRYYALLILGDTNDRLDPIPELRDRIRGADGPSNDPA